ncbi:MAG: DUF3488 and transglutaminase-like domain-containing protein [Ilumatobacteraceae bacterium]
MSTPRLQPIDLWATVALAATTAVTAVTAGRAFSDWQYLRPLLLVALAAHAVALVLRAVRLPGWVAVPAVLVAGLWSISIAYYRSSASGLVPDSSTLDAFAADLRTVIELFPTAVAPVPSASPFAVAAALALVVIVALSDTFAFRAGGHSEAVVPHGAMFVIVAAVGTPLWRVGLALAWTAAAILTVGMLRARDRRRASQWLGNRPTPLTRVVPRLAAFALCAAAVGAVVAPRLPGAGDDPLIDTRTGTSNITEVVSPLVDIRSTLTDSSGRLLFTVESSDGPHYWRLLSLPTFDGSAWNPPAEDLEEFEGSPPGDRSTRARESRQRVTVESLRGPMIPAAYRPVDADAERDVFWAPDSESAIMPGRGLTEGTVIDIVSTVAELSPEMLREVSASPAPDPDYLALPSNIGTGIADLAATLTASAASDFDAALTLQQWFRAEFEYSTDVDFSNSARAIEAFLEARRGFCQQFAGTFAVMARTLGLPARVAVGFTPGDRAADGSYRVFGRHAHAWPEVWFSGIGWVAFEPTPGRGSPDAAAYLGISPEQDPGEEAGGPSTTAPSTTTLPASPTTTVPGATPTTTPTATTVSAAAGGADSGAPVWWLALILALGAWAWFGPSVVAHLARRRRAAAGGRSRALLAWHRAARFAEWAGGGPAAGLTPLEFAAAAGDRVAIGRRDLDALAALAGRVAYSAHGPTQHELDRSEELAARIVAGCRPLLSRRRRVLLRLAPWSEWSTPRRRQPDG